MQIITPGHLYALDNHEDKKSPGQHIQFIEKEKNDAGELITVNDGTTNEDVLAMLIDRMKFLMNKLPSKETACAITKAEECLHWLQARTMDRLSRGVENTPKP